MKKNILILLGLSLSLVAGAAVKQVVHDLGNVYQDPFTCKYDLVVKSTMASKPAYTAYYYYYGDRPETPFDTQKDSIKLNLATGYYTIIVAAGNSQIINAPERKASMGEIPTADLPIPKDFYVQQYDVYTVLVRHPVIEHWDTLYADVLTGVTEFGLYSTLGGKSEDGRSYCGDPNYGDVCELFKNKQSIGIKPFKDMPYMQTLTAGDHLYFVNADTEAINAPTRQIPDIPTSMSVNEVWTDIFYIHVIRPNCYSDLVYTKWTDVLFVDNGGNSAQGFERSEFVAYQWMNEGKKIVGENAQWMRTQGEPTGRYYAEITTKDGKKVFTCPCEFKNLPSSESKNPHSSKGTGVQKRLENGKFIIEIDGATYNALGELVK